MTYMTTYTWSVWRWATDFRKVGWRGIMISEKYLIFCIKKKEYARECHRFLERKHGGMNFKSWLRPLFLGSMCAHVMSEQQRKANISFFKTIRESHLKSGFHPTMFTASNKKTATPDLLSTWRLIEHYSTIFNILTDKVYLFRRELKYRLSGKTALFELSTIEGSLLRNHKGKWRNVWKSSEPPSRQKINPFQLVFVPWLHSTQRLITSPVCFIFICIICIIILILIPILLNIMFMMRLYCGICIECPGRRVGQMRSPSFPKHLFESFWKSNATLSPVLGRNGGSLEDAIYLCTCIPNFMTCQKMP